MELRLRSSYDIVARPLPVTYWPLSCSNRIDYSGGSVGQALTGEKRSMSDYVVPRFHQRQKAGEKFFNTMSKEIVVVSDVGNLIVAESVATHCTSPPVKARTTINGALSAITTPRQLPNSRGHALPALSSALTPQEILRSQSYVSTEVLAKIGTGSSESWESLAEIQKTIAMIQQPVQRLQGLTRRLLQSAEAGGAGRGLLKEISDGYLMYRYGILPAAKDIENVLSSLIKKSGETREVTSRASEQLSAHKTFTGSTQIGSFVYNWLGQCSDVTTIRGMSLNRGYVSFANELGFDLKGLLLLPVQLTSYSFVADWFFNLSSYVKSTIPAFGWQPLGSCLVTQRVISTSYTLTNTVNLTPSVSVLTVDPTGSSSILSNTTTRGALLPSGFVQKSDFRFDDFTRTADALALIAARLVKIDSLLGNSAPRSLAYRNRSAYKRWAEQPGVL